MAEERRRSNNLGWNLLDLVRRATDSATGFFRAIGAALHSLWPF